MYIIIAKSSEGRPSAYFAAEEYPLLPTTLIRVIDIAEKIIHRPVNGIYYRSRCYGWFDLPLNEHQPLNTFLELHPEIEDLDTPEAFSTWSAAHPEAHEPPVDRRNTLAGLYEEYPELLLMSREQKSDFFRRLRDEKRARYAQRTAKNTED